MNWDNTDDLAERRGRLVDVAATHAETVLTAIRLKVHQPIAVDEHEQIQPAGDAIARLAAELQHVVTRYCWLTDAAHRMREVAGRPPW